MKFVTHLIVSSLAVLISAYLLPGVHVDGILTAILVAVVLSFLNSIVKPLIVLLTIPVTVVTFGFFLLVINALMILLADRLVDGFKVGGFWWALIFSLVLSFITSVLNKLQLNIKSHE